MELTALSWGYYNEIIYEFYYAINFICNKELEYFFTAFYTSDIEFWKIHNSFSILHSVINKIIFVVWSENDKENLEYLSKETHTIEEAFRERKRLSKINISNWNLIKKSLRLESKYLKFINFIECFLDSHYWNETKHIRNIVEHQMLTSDSEYPMNYSCYLLFHSYIILKLLDLILESRNLE